MVYGVGVYGVGVGLVVVYGGVVHCALPFTPLVSPLPSFFPPLPFRFPLTPLPYLFPPLTSPLTHLPSHVPPLSHTVVLQK